MFVLRSRYVAQQCVQETQYGAIYLGFDQRQGKATSEAGVVTCADSSEEPHDGQPPPAFPIVAIKQSVLSHAKRFLEQQIVAEDPWQERRVAKTIMMSGGHPNVVQFYDMVEAFGSNFLIMEFCRLGDLHSVLMNASDQRLPEDNALECVRQIASGMVYLHGKGIAHRDLSLENVLLSDDCTYKICDFGLSCCASRSASARVGKGYYMAPEVVDGTTTYDPIRADIWSLGMVLFILLTGSPLFEFAGPSCAGFNMVKQSGVQIILQHWGMEHLASTSTIDLLNRMIDMNLSTRFSSMDQVLAHPALRSSSKP